MFCSSQMECMVNLMASLIRPAPATCPTASPEIPSYILLSFAILMLKKSQCRKLRKYAQKYKQLEIEKNEKGFSQIQKV